MISKEMFCKVIDAIQKDRENDEKLGNALDKYLLNGYAVVKTSATFQALIELLKDIFNDNDKYSTIEWWLFDNVDKYIYDEDKNIIADLTKVEDLYDYLVENIQD